MRHVALNLHRLPGRDVDIAVDTTLDYLLDFVQEFSAQLASQQMYSEALTAGLVHNEIRRLRSS